jgi:hypothetical protein
MAACIVGRWYAMRRGLTYTWEIAAAARWQSESFHFVR